ncbi:hypothetical protein [Longimicrobium sp.]|uniref:hypothetical protein n=1 Tax=Longimicrobium sp. TaxID=2029185 RepID=UPI002E2F8C1B|nr:hypothetical protein [Longimicrobium sp.]HEX6038313.1 hypothetical protein [Longimicrobium sp.]
MNDTDPDLLLSPAEERELLPSRLMGLMSLEEREVHAREILARRTPREKIVDGLRRAWYGPDPEPLTDEEMRMIMRPRDDEDDGLPERVPPDDPERLAWEAELRAIGVRPARKWNFPVREPFRRPSLWERIKYRVSRGW